MISFLTLFLGLQYGAGKVVVEFSAGPGVARVELYVDGSLAAEMGRPPWRARIDLGGEIAPHELVAIARDARGARVGEARQWVNRARPDAEARFILEHDPSGRATAARLVWRCLVSPKPLSISVSFDGEPIESKDPARIPIPPHSKGASHVLVADLTFAEGIMATAVVSVGGTSKGDSSRELTAFPIRLSDGKRSLPAPAKLAGWCETGGRPLAVAAVEKGPAEVVFVGSGLVREDLQRLAREDYWPFPWPRPHPIELPDATQYRFLVPAPKTLEDEPAPTRVFPVSETFTPLDGRFLLLASTARFAGDASLPRVAEAVAVSGLSATARERRRAVVLLLGKGNLESSDFDAGHARRYLERLRVPLYVWRLAPGDAPVAPGWSDAVDASTIEGLREAFRLLRRDLSSQRIVWLEGRVDPSKIEVGSGAVGVVTGR